MIALVLIAALNCGDSATQMDLNVCASERAKRSEARESAVAPRDASEAAWRRYRDAACKYAAANVAGGSIEPMVTDNCYADLADQRANDIKRWAPVRAGIRPRAEPSAAREEAWIYGNLELRVDLPARPLLSGSERSWVRYRTAVCAGKTAACATALTRERTQTLKNSWIAERFW